MLLNDHRTLFLTSLREGLRRTRDLKYIKPQAILLSGVNGAILHSASQLSTTTYDFIIVGAGPGGSAVANRLSEDAKTTVLLVEAGGLNDDDITLEVPLLCTRLTPSTRWDWNYTTTPQAGLNGRSVPFPRGIGLGGSSAVNCLVYTRGSKENIDEWAKLSGDESWGWDQLLPYFKKSEKFNFPVDGHNITGQFDPSVHGFDGFIGVSVPNAPRAIDGRIIQTTQELEEFPFKLDMNSGEHLGVGWVQSLIDRGVRSSSKAYLVAPDVAKRPNLDILLNAQVSRALRTSTSGSTMEFKGVEFKDRTDGAIKTLAAKKEVILSAGAVSSPVILMHSGIGPKSLLDSLNITTHVDLPSVGQNLTDHIGVSSTWSVNSTLTFDTVLRNDTLLESLLEEWRTNKTGLLTVTSENHAAFLRIPENSSFWEEFQGQDPAAGKNTAHFEFLFQNGLSVKTDQGNFFNFPTGNVSPLSRGSVTINSSDPFAAPLIDPGLLTNKIDIVVVREAIRSARRFLTASAWDGYLLEAMNTAETDDELDEYIRQEAVSFFHPVATAAMSPVGADWGVVDPDLKVKGVVGLRVVDAAVAPSLPSAHTSAAVYAIAEKASDLIKAAWGII
ncbi:hypothetical protein QCA50_008028 [Cerrena zonata]|uniref:Glucose-methanol-choline oxidoreductase N-terminal domain-containing protein n=1 Tax=Cerrena zonata TaxID=2478898 RepID=A0AAW0GBH5_9APHY